MRIEPSAIPDILQIWPVRHGDDRGFFSETWNAGALSAQGHDWHFVQDNHVRNGARGTLRGLHLQLAPNAQGKLIRCLRGSILDVAVDVRKGSPEFGRHVAVELSEADWNQLWIPPGFAHGYCTLTDGAEVIYKVTASYDPAAERGIAFDDPALGIDWPVDRNTAHLSEKDRTLPTLAEFGGV